MGNIRRGDDDRHAEGQRLGGQDDTAVEGGVGRRRVTSPAGLRLQSGGPAHHSRREWQILELSREAVQGQ